MGGSTVDVLIMLITFEGASALQLTHLVHCTHLNVWSLLEAWSEVWPNRQY